MTSRLFLPLLLVLATLSTPSVEASPVLTLSSEGKKISRLIIGDHLEVALSNGTPGEFYQFRLIDSDAVVVAAGYAVANLAGQVPLHLLWAYSGVVGCDYPPFVPAPYRYQHFSDAEAELNQQTLQVQVLSSAGVQVALKNLPLVTVKRELAYFSNASGCLRRRFEDSESVYLSMRHPSRSTPTRRFFLAEGSNIEVGSTITDAREGISLYSLPPSGNPVTFLVWSGAASAKGFYSGVLRWEALTTPTVTGSDLRLVASEEASFSPNPTKGLVITIDGCPSCDP